MNVQSNMFAINRYRNALQNCLTQPQLAETKNSMNCNSPKFGDMHDAAEKPLNDGSSVLNTQA